MRYRVRLKSTTFYIKKLRYKYQGINGYLAICLNEKQKQQLKEQRYDEIARAKELISKKKNPNKKTNKFFRGKSLNHTTIKEAEILDGVSAIFCTKNLNENEMIHGYFEKDRVKKAFRRMKGLLEMDKIRFWLTGKVNGHIFVCYLSYLLLSLLDYKLKKININATDAIDLMESMYKVFITDTKTKNKFVKTVALSTQQEKVMRAINKKLLKT